MAHFLFGYKIFHVFVKARENVTVVRKKNTDFSSFLGGRCDLVFELRPQHKSHTTGDVRAKFGAYRSKDG